MGSAGVNLTAPQSLHVHSWSMRMVKCSDMILFSGDSCFLIENQ